MPIIQPRTADFIWELADKSYPNDYTKQRQKIRRLFREQDESEKFPIRGSFNVTNRAIENISEEDYDNSPFDYAHAIDREITCIVNDESNW